MVLRVIEATQAKPGTTILIDNEPYAVESNDISKTGKHGASKCRIMARGIFNDKKKILAVPGSERFDVPNIKKTKVQILGFSDSVASVMDLESYETIEVPYHEGLKEKIKTEAVAELWEIEEKKVLMRIL